ncbi:MAG: hypothetical protein WA993_15580 [Candidatus Binatus sp.]|jgi:hypothetical protein|uniref:hypothetical protein n=1 Tax=Candidatus Binatus sp. TaxID=2811406 RepID=UPI003C933DDD
MKNGLLAIPLLASLAIIPPTQAVAEPQQEFAPPPGGQSPGSQSPQGNQALEVVPSQNNRILELPPLVDGALPPPPQPLINPEIPSPFIGCWEGTVERWDSAVGNFQNVTISKPGRIVFCYRPNHIDVPVAELEAEFAAPAWIKGIATHLGFRLDFVKVDRNDISNRIYAITPSQIYARTFVPLSIIGHWRWVLPVPKHAALVDEELVQKKDLDHLSVQARQELEVDGLPAVRTWHADFHRTADPD